MAVNPALLLEQLNQWCNSHKPTLSLSYQVPMLGEGGTCSLFGELDDSPFDLMTELREHELSVVEQVQSVVDWVKHKTRVDWFGVYLSRENLRSEKVLTKLAYFGSHSRAEFPLSETFSKLSNNVSVGLTGQQKVINDVSDYRAQGGEYYTCDPKVQSELCLPIFEANHNCLQNGPNNYLAETSENPKIIGIIDAECFATNCFDEETQMIFSVVCAKLTEILTLR